MHGPEPPQPPLPHSPEPSLSQEGAAFSLAACGQHPSYFCQPPATSSIGPFLLSSVPCGCQTPCTGDLSSSAGCCVPEADRIPLLPGVLVLLALSYNHVVGESLKKRRMVSKNVCNYWSTLSFCNYCLPSVSPSYARNFLIASITSARPCFPAVSVTCDISNQNHYCS